MKEQPELRKAILIMSGDEKWKRGTIKRASEAGRLPELTLRRWLCYGLPVREAYGLWEKVNRWVDLADLTAQSGQVGRDKRKEKRAGVAV